ncbi:hypothetical protein V3564_04865 [Bartonella sp. B12(2025)]
MIWRVKKNFVLMMAALAAFFMAIAKAFYLGKKFEQQKQTKKVLEAAATRLKVENEINKKSDADVRADLSDWVRDK